MVRPSCGDHPGRAGGPSEPDARFEESSFSGDGLCSILSGPESGVEQVNSRLLVSWSRFSVACRICHEDFLAFDARVGPFP